MIFIEGIERRFSDPMQIQSWLPRCCSIDDKFEGVHVDFLERENYHSAMGHRIDLGDSG
ncbi:hypothetical protein OROGR_009592 [Orobanche gracilis]